MQKTYEVVVIGAGISGIASSNRLASAGIDHIILESRDRIGGRIVSGEFAGGPVQLGASFVHHPNGGNRVAQLLADWGWKTTSADYASVQYLLQGGVQPKSEEVYESQLAVSDFMEKLKDRAEAVEEKDISLEEAARELLEGKGECSQEVKSLVRWGLDILGNIQGAELKEISAREFQNDEDGNDFLPEDGYASILEKLVEGHNQTIIFGFKVTAIDYSNHPIKIYAGEEVYSAERVISSLPLGVLQAGLVQFRPSLPEAHNSALHKIGNGVANKIFVRFTKPFWDQSKRWINFVSRDRSNRYPVAYSMGEGKHVLYFFVSGDASKELSQLSDSAIQADLVKFLREFSPNEEVVIEQMLVTRWHKDPHSLGSYSYIPIGTSVQDLNTMRKPIAEKLWFVGEYCHPEMNGCAHAAYETGVWAAEEVIAAITMKSEQ